jgi:NAD(P)-dependent dehydrogenase (short-subunit alcohol dehydrogenase family)
MKRQQRLAYCWLQAKHQACSGGAVEDTALEDARRQFEVNLFGVAAPTRAVLPHMRK